MANNDKVMVGNFGHWVKVEKNGKWVHLALGEDGETHSGKNIDQWEVFQVIQKLAEVSGLLLDRTGVGGLIVGRPENPKEVERREELAAKFSGGAWDFKDVSPDLQQAILFIIAGEVERGEL